MRIGISRPSRTPEESLEVLQCADAYGFEGVQLKPAQYEPFLDSPAAFRERYGDLARLASGGLIVYPGGDPAAWDAKLDAVLAFAGAVAAGHVCICAGVFATGAPDAQVQTVADTLTRIGKRAHVRRLAVSIHNHVGSLVETETDIARLLDRLDPSICGLTLDTAHAAKAGITDVAALVHRFRDHLLNVHLKDLDRAGGFCPLGEGTLDIAPIYDAIEAIEYQQWLIVDEETSTIDTPTAFRLAAGVLRHYANGW